MTRTTRNVLPLLAALVTGCSGYAHLFPLPKGAEGARTVAIEIFANKTTETDLGFDFTAALQRELCAKTPLRVADRGEADTLVNGAVEAFERIPLREFETDDVARYSIALTVSYTFTRLPTGGVKERVVSSAKKLRRSAEYEVMSNITEADARREAVRKIARKVVSHMFETW
jgi:hypothetical protein